MYMNWKKGRKQFVSLLYYTEDHIQRKVDMGGLSVKLYLPLVVWFQLLEILSRLVHLF